MINFRLLSPSVYLVCGDDYLHEAMRHHLAAIGRMGPDSYMTGISVEPDCLGADVWRIAIMRTSGDVLHVQQHNLVEYRLMLQSTAEEARRALEELERL